MAHFAGESNKMGKTITYLNKCFIAYYDILYIIKHDQMFQKLSGHHAERVLVKCHSMSGSMCAVWVGRA